MGNITSSEKANPTNEEQPEQKEENSLYSIENCTFPSLKYDSEGFVESFAVDDPKSRDFFQEYGFVVFRNVLSPQECQATLDEFWNQEGLDRNNPVTWETYWSSQRFKRFAIIGSFPDIESLTQLANRQNPNVHKGFSMIFGTEKLWVDHDRLGIMRPTKGIVFPNSNEPVDKPAWRTIERWLHLDSNPNTGEVSLASFEKTYSNTKVDLEKTLMLQGLITLTDAREEDGGFQCVPGFHKYCSAWARKPELPQSSANIQVPENDPVRNYIKKVPMKKGSLLLWNSLLLHANYPNDSSNFRAVQYIRMIPTVDRPYKPLVNSRTSLPENFKISELGEKLFGFKNWEQ